MTFCTVAMYVSKDIHVHMYMFRVCTNVYVLAHELHSFCTYVHTYTNRSSRDYKHVTSL